MEIRVLRLFKVSKVVYFIQSITGCLGDNRVGAGNLDESAHYEVKRFRVNVRCPCLFWSCLNGGVCMAGSPPYCMCAAGYIGEQCGQRIDMPLVGKQNVAS